MTPAAAARTDGRVVPRGLESSPGKLVYLYLNLRGATTVERLADDLDLAMLTLCGVLAVLEERGYVERVGDSYRCAG